MIKLITSILFIIISTTTFAIDKVKLSARFGTISISSANLNTSGSSFIFESELYLDEQWGVLLNGGVANTESDDLVTTDSGDITNQLKLKNQFFQTGFFVYPLQGLRGTVGLGVHSVDSELALESGDSRKDSDTHMGAFTSLGYTHYVGNFLIGAEYNYAVFDEYNQSGFYFIFGLAF